MFGYKPKQATDVPGILEEGQSWVTRLETASAVTAERAEDLETAAVLMQEDAAAIRQTADEGKAVAANFRKFLFIQK